MRLQSERRKLRCEKTGCSTPFCEYLAPCDEHPEGAIRIVGKHHGERHVGIFDIASKTLKNESELSRASAFVPVQLTQESVMLSRVAAATGNADVCECVTSAAR